jgi:thiamine-phosphate pyrophosphorylase
MKSLAACRLYAFVDTGYLRGRNPETVARQLCEGGADLIQFRAKGTPVETLLDAAIALRRVTEDAGVGLVINDHINLAREVGADFCHLGQEDFFGAGFGCVSELSPKSSGAVPSPQGNQPGIGLSTHTPDQAKRALAAAPDYVAIGPVYATPTKPGARPVTLDYVRWAAANVCIPWFAIGGINLQTLDEVLQAGATRVCVVSAILNADSVTSACREFANRLR